ncbi:LysR family transcriptional regulator [Planctomicrobium sp. SH668]|uniref:LysR family transcriptional regulator n=1 Tax=Planctomicrobium sp. SH668 TaxID=3448126 RepID=UPI003F5C6CED
MNIRNTEIFCEIATHRSLTRAGEVRQISQSAVSQALQQLEEKLGVMLVDRSKRPIELTAAGKVYYERCQQWLQDYQEIEDAVLQLTDRIHGRVRVSSIYSVGLLQMSTYVRRLKESYPEIELSLDYEHPETIYNRIQRDEIDLGIVSYPRVGGEISCISWQDQEMVVAVAQNNPLSSRSSIRLEELDKIPFVAFTADLTIRRRTEKLFKSAGIAVNVTHQFDNIENIKRAVEIDLGVALIPLTTMRRELEIGTLAAIHLSDVSFVRPLGIVHKRHKHLSRAAEKFVELLNDDPGDSAFVASQAIAAGATP